MTKGTIKWFNHEKAYGFIKQDNGGSDIFVHLNVLEKSGISNIREGQAVEFDISTDRQGRESASKISLL